jgi:hypothetical protein
VVVATEPLDVGAVVARYVDLVLAGLPSAAPSQARGAADAGVPEAP